MKRSKFNLSHTQLHTGRMGVLIPVGLLEVLPGDTIQHAAQALIRSAPLATPPMHPVRIDVRHFFVPNRLVWDEWEDFITGGPDGMNESVFPTYAAPSQVGSLFDHMGIPPVGTSVTVNALPIRAITMIWNEFYRDQDLQAPIPISKASGVDTTEYPDELKVNWEKDYFTTSRPWEQKGPDVTLPLGTSATGTASITTAGVVGSPTGYPLVPGPSDVGTFTSIDTDVKPFPGGQMELRGDVDIDLSTATAATVNQLRLALAWA